MVCKIADSEQGIGPLFWRRIGADQSDVAEELSSSTDLVRARGSGAEIKSARNTAAQNLPSKSGQVLNQLGSLQRRVAELETQGPLDVQKARQAGLEQGLRQAREEGATEMQNALDKLAKTIQEVAQVKRKARQEAETEMVKLSLAIAKRILHRELSADPQSIRGIVYAALDRLQNREINRIRVFPAAVQAVRSALERNGGVAAIEITPDETLPAGSIFFETALGELDASVHTQLQEIERGFADRLRG